MTTSLRCLLISAAFAVPVLAQSSAPSKNSFLNPVFRKLTTDQEVVDLVKKAGFNPSVNALGLNLFNAATPRCTLGVWGTISEDGSQLLFTTKLRDLTPYESAHSDDLLAHLTRTTPGSNLVMRFQILGIGTTSALALQVMVPNRGATPSEVIAAVTQLADVGVAIVTARQ